MSSSGLSKVICALGSQLNRTYKINVKKRTISDSHNNNFDPYSKYQIEDFYYDINNNHLSFQIIRYTYKPKIERYITINYEKHPVYSPYKSITTKCMKKFSKTINLKIFCEMQLLKEKFVDDIKYDVEIRKTICELLNYEPKWLKILNNINDLNNQIEQLKQNFKNFHPVQYSYRPKLQDIPSNLILRLFFLPFTLGLSFIGFISKKRALINKEKNLKIDEWNQNHKKDIDKFNKKESDKIFNHNNCVTTKINFLLNKIKNLENNMNNFKPSIDSNGWIDIRESFLFDNNDLKNVKGIYIIWNKSNNKYYVGQTKNLYNRIFMQHFDRIKQCPKNYLFFADWNLGNKFYYRVEKVNTKDELDRLEKKYIEEYDSFRNGYNSTSGNK